MFGSRPSSPLQGWSKAKRRLDITRRGNAKRATVRVAVEHLFAVQKRRLGLVIRTIGKRHAEAKLGLANLVTNRLRLVWFETTRLHA